MSIYGAMFAGVSGMSAQSDALAIVGDNLSNANTVGFKDSRAVFENLIGGSVGEDTIGAGVRMSGTQQLFTQGTLINTGNNTDCALSGDGFFVVNGAVSGMPGTYYTRNGQFNVNANGQLVNQDNMQVQGYAYNPTTQTYAAGLSTITVPTAALAPNTTKTMTVTANLDAAATAPALPWDPQNPSTTSNFSTSMNVYDSLGTAHQLSVYFVKDPANNTWDYHVLAPTADMAAGGATQNTEVGTGTLNFTTGGALQSVNTTLPMSVSFAGGATANQNINLAVGTAIGAGGQGTDGITQYQETSNVSSQSQDGYASGDLAGINIDSSGVVNGVYTNGQTIAVGKLAVAKFQNDQGLAKAGQNVWAQTSDSGLAAIGTGGSGGRGAIVSGSLEQSNVDTTSEFVNMISDQRGFEASSKVITTSDQMLQDVVNLIR